MVRRRWTLKAAVVVGLAVMGTLVTAVAVHAAHTPCDDEGLAGGDLGNNFGPGIVFFGVDALGSPSACVTTGGPLPESSESVIAGVEDPDPATPGATVDLSRRTCADWDGTECDTDSVVGQTGVEDPGATPAPDLPGDGTAGLSLGLGWDCLWVNGDASCGGADVTTTVWETDVPDHSSGGCILDVDPGAGCDVQGFQVVVFGDAENPTARVARSGLPVVPDGGTNADPERACVAVGKTCE
jgi:hypothetical protein